MDRVRDAMVPEPRTLSGDSPAQEAGELLSRPEVRAVFVAEDERLAGVITKLLARLRTLPRGEQRALAAQTLLRQTLLGLAPRQQQV